MWAVPLHPELCVGTLVAHTYGKCRPFWSLLASLPLSFLCLHAIVLDFEADGPGAGAGGAAAEPRVGSRLGGNVGPESAGGREDDFLFLLMVAWPLVSSASSKTCGGGGTDGSSLAGGRSSPATTGMVVDPATVSESRPASHHPCTISQRWFR